MKTIQTITTYQDFQKFSEESKGTWRAFKVTYFNGWSKFKDEKTGKRLQYKPGRVVRAPSIQRDRHEDCGAGINIGSLSWARTNAGWLFGFKKTRIFLVECQARGAVIPIGSNGKFRVRKVRVLHEVDRHTGEKIEKALRTRQ